MPRYRIQGLTASGLVQESVVAAANLTEAEKLARQTGLQILDIRLLSFALPLFKPKPSFDLALFAHELKALLKAGLSLVETLEALRERQQDASARGGLILAELLRAMREGKPFSQALSAFPDEFPELFVASIAASEQTGEMQAALERYLRYHEQMALIRQKIVSAALYPAMLMVVGGGVALFLLCYLVPRFAHVYEDMGEQLPLASRLLMQWGMFVSQHEALVAVSIAVFSFAAISAVGSPVMRQCIAGILQRNRFVGGQLRLMQLSRFYRSLGLLLQGGIPALKAMRMTQPLLAPVLQQAMEQAILSVSQGQSLSTSLQSSGLTTPVALRLLRAGERNGQLADMLEQTAAFHDREVEQWVERFAKLFEPVLMLLIGGVIGGIVVLLYLPIFELAGSLR